MHCEWILIANASRARLLRHEPGSPMSVLQAFRHDKSRQQAARLGDDKAGRELSGRGFGGAAFEPHIDAQRKEHISFARELAAHLEQAAQEEQFDSLCIFASSPFLGELKHELRSATQRLLSGAHDVDLTSVGLAELDRRVEYELAQPH